MTSQRQYDVISSCARSMSRKKHDGTKCKTTHAVILLVDGFKACINNTKDTTSISFGFRFDHLDVHMLCMFMYECHAIIVQKKDCTR